MIPEAHLRDKYLTIGLDNELRLVHSENHVQIALVHYL